MMLLFSIPVVGWLACIVMAFVSKNGNRRNFAKAMLVFLIIGAVLAVMCFFLFKWVWEAVVDYAQETVSEATGGAMADLGGLKDLPGLLGGLAIPSGAGRLPDTPEGMAPVAVGLGGVSREVMVGVGDPLFDMEVGDAEPFSAAWAAGFGDVSQEEYDSYIAYLDGQEYGETGRDGADAYYVFDWGEMQIGYESAGAQLFVTWLVD
jgi:hypothetical protein